MFFYLPDLLSSFYIKNGKWQWINTAIKTP